MSKNTATKVAKSPAPKAAAKPAAKAPVKTAAKPVAKASAKAPAKPACANHAATKAAPKKVTVEFVADCPLASTVSVAGSFNNWTVDVDMLKKDKKSGLWTAKIALVPGDYEYKFVCDGANWDAGDNKIKHV